MSSAVPQILIHMFCKYLPSVAAHSTNHFD